MSMVQRDFGSGEPSTDAGISKRVKSHTGRQVGWTHTRHNIHPNTCGDAHLQCSSLKSEQEVSLDVIIKKQQDSCIEAREALNALH